MTATRGALALGDLHPALSDPALDSMTFLNDVAQRYPDAISFAAGRPTERYFDVGTLPEHLRRFEVHLGQARRLDLPEVNRLLLQYGRTKGIIHDLVARHLEIDEDVRVDAEAIVVTVGCQEAMFLVLRALRADERDAVLAITPAYVGLTGAARLLDLPVIGVPGGPAGADLPALHAAARQARADGLRPRACYVVPDFANPSGLSLDLATRRALLDFADDEELLLLEDNPYGLFGPQEDRLPTLKALDGGTRVVYLGSFAKSVLPGVRIGFAVADQPVIGPDGRTTLFADHLAKIKSMVTLNTPPVAQAIAAGQLLANGCSLRVATARENAVYRETLTRVLGGLDRRLGPTGVRWNRPRGGFFVVVTVPFRADDPALEHSASEHGVLWTPMRHFYTGTEADQQIRLSISAVPHEDIDEGLDRFAEFCAQCTTAGSGVR